MPHPNLDTNLPPRHRRQLARLLRRLHLHLIPRDCIQNNRHLVADLHIRSPRPRSRNRKHVFHPQRHFLRPPRHRRRSLHLEIPDSHNPRQFSRRRRLRWRSILVPLPHRQRPRRDQIRYRWLKFGYGSGRADGSES